jgi:hypothetical protein
MLNFTPAFRADRPFPFLIRDRRSGSILFPGRSSNPGESPQWRHFPKCRMLETAHMKTLPIITALLVSTALADEPKPVPALQALPLPHHQASLQRDGVELARYHFDPGDRRPFWYPIRSSTGRSLTRMGHPHDPVTHSHHNSVWISHNGVNGLDFWGDQGKGKGKIVHQRVLEFWDGDDSSGMRTLNHWIGDGAQTPLLEEIRQSEIVPGPDGSWFLIIDLKFTVPKGATQPVAFQDTAFGLIGVRMAKSIGVNDGGGRILNSAGQIGEKAIFRKPARWVDYSGKITNEQPAGITLMDHPDNLGFPSPFHVRADGWMGICLTFEKTIEVTEEKPLVRRYALWVHDGVPDVATADRAFEVFAKRAVRKFE